MIRIMIKTKKDLQSYIDADLAVQPYSKNMFRRIFSDKVIKLKKHLRYCEYYHNVDSCFLRKIRYFYHKIFLRHYLDIFCSEIPENVFGKGLMIWHPQGIMINGSSRVGDYCSISRGVVIAQAKNQSPIVGNHCEIMIDAKILGGISVADNVRIGAGAIVVKSIEEADTTWAGVPAKKINNRGTIEVPALEIK